ncbi:selenocysteine-specific elongation factor [Roseateles sp. YR242]|uniref:selenocysteine-specific translation elongation factor n=1 Tax=Roseateles sp. YR242 TaxID=1855305 RepID=UPI0008B8E138|nr:selenocysteine-specific translation elongation factor [Roseateles sp. YR242]SEK32962.1 selenocysteine-specific elongation factor [Roseateles sp. YR242]
MIIGTAGHIDHGKTTLVKALTGVDTDRLPEEKQRGISIALGYAYLEGPEGQRLGFVDVPGHERLVHTMLSGATGIDHALLLVAADDGVMPQTREHLALLSLLGIDHGTVVLTKCDRVDEAQRAQRRAEVAELLAHTALRASPVFEVAATTGQGVDILRDHLLAQARARGRREVSGQGFRLAVDRVFSLSGVGTVCTGTAFAGEVSIGEELQLIPPAVGQDPRPARVRSLHAQNAAATQAHAGQRVALGLAGVDKDQVARGQWWAAPEVALWSDRMDVRLRVWFDEQKPLRSGAQVHVHLGASQSTASIAVLGTADGEPLDAIQPGNEALVQLVLHHPLCGWAGDRVVLRDASATRALAGGTVLDPLAPARYRRTAQRLSELKALQSATPSERLRGMLDQAPLGVDVQRFAAAQGVARSARATWLGAALPEDDSVCVVPGLEGPLWALGAAQTAQARQLALERLTLYHQQQPDELGPDLARWRRLSLPRLAEPLWRALVHQLVARGEVGITGAAAHLPAHGVQLSALDERLAQRVMPMLLDAGFEGAWARDLAKNAGEPEALVRTTLSRLAQRGELFQVVKDLYYAPAHIESLARLARGSALDDGEVTAAVFRDRTGLGRKRAIQVLEFFDRVGLLRRVGDAHKLRADCRLFLDEDEAPGQQPVGLASTA